MHQTSPDTIQVEYIDVGGLHGNQFTENRPARDRTHKQSDGLAERTAGTRVTAVRIRSILQPTLPIDYLYAGDYVLLGSADGIACLAV